jgi:hypothetical protein
MTDQQHPITPPLELVHQWADMLASRSDQAVFTMAAQWGADMELKACCQSMKSIPSPLGVPFGEMASNALRATRRPKPPSLKEQAQVELDRLIALIPSEGALAMAEPIRRALEALPNG